MGNQEATYHILEPGHFRLDGGAMFGIIPKPLWEKVHPADSQNRINLALRLLLIQIANRKILIDTGIGDYHPDRFNQMFDVRIESSPLEKCLGEIGVSPDQITDLVLSHLHFDHTGGISKQGSEEFEVIFKNATLHLHEDHYQYSKNPTDRDGGSFHSHIFEPAIEYYSEKKQINWLTKKSKEILKTDEGYILQFLTTHGHTPFMIHPYDQKLIYLADIIPTSNHIKIPWVMGYDIHAGESTRNKKEVLEFICQKELVSIFEHDPKFCGAKIALNEKGAFVPTNKIDAENKSSYLVELNC